MAEKPAQTPTALTITLTNADQEYSQLFPNGIKRFSFQCDSFVDVRFSFETGKVATPTRPYMTLKAGYTYYEDDVNLTGKQIFFASSTAGAIIELLVWK